MEFLQVLSALSSLVGIGSGIKGMTSGGPKAPQINMPPFPAAPGADTKGLTARRASETSGFLGEFQPGQAPGFLAGALDLPPGAAGGREPGASATPIDTASFDAMRNLLDGMG